jgi:hypothetical protein
MKSAKREQCQVHGMTIMSNTIGARDGFWWVRTVTRKKDRPAAVS